MGLGPEKAPGSCLKCRCLYSQPLSGILTDMTNRMGNLTSGAGSVLWLYPPRREHTFGTFILERSDLDALWNDWSWVGGEITHAYRTAKGELTTRGKQKQT